MKILEIEIKNFKKVEAMLLELDGKSLRVAGTTGQGKTTAISTLWDIMETVGDPINHGNKKPGSKASLQILLGDEAGKPLFVAERIYTTGDTSISIRAADDKKKKITAKEFKSWVSSLAKNPHKIMELGPTEQTQTLLRAAKMPEGIDLAKIDQDRAAAHEKREDQRKEVARLKADQGIKPRKVEPVDIQAAISELTELKDDQTNVRVRRESLLAERAGRQSRIKDLRTQLEMEEAKLKAAEDGLVELEDWESDNIDPLKIQELEKTVSRSQEINEEARKYTDWVKAQDKLEKAEAEFAEQDQKVKDLDAQKKKALESIQWPIDGLSIQDGVIHFKGVPLDQCGNSEQLLVCGAMAVEDIKSKELKVVRLDGVESMSAEDFTVLEKLFEDNGIQVLSSRVTRGDLDDGEILIHEGKVLEVSQ